MVFAYETTLHRRNILLLVFVGIFVLSIVTVTISIIIINPKGDEEVEYLGKKNVLFIIVDDLRPALGCYGDQRAITPNMDQLASKGILFKNAYAQQALCAVSRTSFLTSRRPDSLHLYDKGSYWRDEVGNFVTLPQHFKYHGYETVSVGKIFDHGIVSNMTDDYPFSWTEYPFHPPMDECKEVSPDGQIQMNLICPVDIGDVLPDIANTKYAIEYLKNKTSGPKKDNPFFLAVGYYKPHIPFKFPKEYLKLYPIDSMALDLNQTTHLSMPEIAWNPWTDLRERDDVKALNVSFPYGPIPEELQLRIRQGYYASVSYIDDQIGQLLQALEDTGYADHTTIVFLGDHGWSLGEHQEWSKYSNFEVSLRVPLMVSVPEMMGGKDRTPFHYEQLLTDNSVQNHTTELRRMPSLYKPKYVTDEFVELVDLFPTLAQIVDIAIPPLCRIYRTDLCSEGLGFYSLIKHLLYEPWVDFSWKTGVFSQYPRPSTIPQPNSDQPALSDIKYMGYSVRTRHYRYTEWMKFNSTIFEEDMDCSSDTRELYDHNYDPAETNNVIDDPEYHYVAAYLCKKLKKGWRHAMPPGYFDSPRVHKFHRT